jgi:hypothetical protein
MAVNYKDAVFNSSFDISAITNACKRRDLTFDHNVTILPGCAYARILGTKNKALSTLTNDVGSKTRNNDMPIQAINEQRRNCVKYKRRDLTGSYY